MKPMKPPANQAEVTAETARRFRENPSRCLVRPMAETILDLDLSKARVEIDPHYPCAENCPAVLTRNG